MKPPRWKEDGNTIYIMPWIDAGLVTCKDGQWLAYLLTPTGRYRMGMEGMSRKTVKRDTKELAMAALEAHFMKLHPDSQKPVPLTLSSGTR